MALEIKSTPVLEGEEASRFIENAEQTAKAPKKEFSAQVSFAQKIIDKSF